ncbi:putative nuclease HARBI1 [Dreissena polymorpha]|uniref:putative nuclease HARBI1 n=1 Tax=Dreissena polymorpha TaxID=45954 RepID=UPI00226465C1|nr:putative nuclease HARBI1 [Dreissena polymorpha]
MASTVLTPDRKPNCFPQVVGVVDGTHIRIQAPSANEDDYVNRKGFHSLNVQMICDATFWFVDVVAKWPGSVHDSRIFRESAIRQRFERGEINGLLLGDSGYGCKRYLMTPYQNTDSPCKLILSVSSVVVVTPVASPASSSTPSTTAPCIDNDEQF